MHRFGGNAAHLPCLLFPIGVAGVGVSAVADDSLRVAVGNILTGNGNGSALDKILRIRAGCGAANIATHHGKIELGLVAAHSAVNSGGGKSERRSNSSGNNF